MSLYLGVIQTISNLIFPFWNLVVFHDMGRGKDVWGMYRPNLGVWIEGREAENICTESSFRKILIFFCLQVFKCFWKVGPCQSWNFEFLEVFWMLVPVRGGTSVGHRLVPVTGGTSSFWMFLEGWSLSELELRVSNRFQSGFELCSKWGFDGGLEITKKWILLGPWPFDSVKSFPNCVCV